MQRLLVLFIVLACGAGALGCDACATGTPVSVCPLVWAAPPTPAIATTFAAAASLDGWEIDHTGADASSYELDHGFHVISIEHAARGTNSWADVTASRRVEPMAGFAATVRVAWNDDGLRSAMQRVGLQLIDVTGVSVIEVWYDDPWIAHRGTRAASIDGEVTMSMRDGKDALPGLGGATIEVTRDDGVVRVRWDDEMILMGDLDVPVAEMRLVFSRSGYSDASIGDLWVESARLEPVASDPCRRADVSGDGVVSVEDLNLVLQSWNETCNDGSPNP